MTAKVPKIGDILITTPKYYEWIGHHAIYEVVHTNTDSFIIRIIFCNNEELIGDEIFFLYDKWWTSDNYINIS